MELIPELYKRQEKLPIFLTLGCPFPDRRYLYSRHMNDQVKPPMKDWKSPHRCSYLLRLWCTDELRGFHWQASLEIPKTGERIGFASLEELFAYLMDLTTADDI